METRRIAGEDLPVWKWIYQSGDPTTVATEVRIDTVMFHVHVVVSVVNLHYELYVTTIVSDNFTGSNFRNFREAGLNHEHLTLADFSPCHV